MKANNKSKLILIGAGGHCKSCIDVIESMDEYDIAGLLDDEKRIGESILNYKIIGGDSIIERLIGEGYHFLVTVGQISSAETRKKLFSRLQKGNAHIATVIASSARVSKYSTVGAGTIVMHNAIVNAGAVIGLNCIINTAAIIEHDAKIEDHCHISTHATVNGECIIGAEVFIGSGAVVSNSLKIVQGTIVGAGTTVHRSLNEKGTYAGQPFRKIK